MNKLMKLRKNKKGFTLVELLVVLVIIVILMAAIIPSMLGFIDKAREEATLAECRNVSIAANAIANEMYGLEGSVDQTKMTAKIADIAKMAGITPATDKYVIGTVTVAGNVVTGITYKASDKKDYTYGTFDGKLQWRANSRISTT